MRLHSLRLAAIGPFVDSQYVDFDRLTQSGLFLLEGPTGAGKTTVLDAITFALYGAVSGDGSGNSRMHSDFDPSVKPSVELEFTASGRRFRICRTPQHERPKKRGSGTTTERHRVQLYARGEDGGWELLSTGHQEVADLVQLEIGLNREQFTQVVLLPQGEFARFLRADDDERRKVLTRLFDAEKFDQIVGELQVRAKAARETSAEQIQEISRQLAAAAEAGAAPADVVAAWNPESTRLPDELARYGDVLAAAAAAASGDLAAAQSHHRLCEQSESEAGARLQLLQRWQQLDAQRVNLDAAAVDHKSEVERLARAEAAEALRPFLEAQRQSDERVAACRLALAACRKHDGLLGDTAPVGDGSDFSAMSRDFADTVAGLRHLVELEVDLDRRRGEMDDTRKTLAELAAGVASARAELAGLHSRSAQVAVDLAVASEGAATLALAEVELAQWVERCTAAEELQRLRPQLAAAVAAAQARVDDHQDAVEEVQRLQLLRIAGMTSELAALLVEGQPCSVCGSPEHPEPAISEDGPELVTDADLDVAAERVRTALAARGEAEELRRSVESAVQAVAAKADGGDPSAAREVRDAAELRVEEARAAKTRLAQLELEQVTLADRLTRLGEALSATEAESAACQARVDVGTAALAADEQSVVDAAAGFVTVAERVTQLEAAAIEAANIAETIRTLRQAEATQAQADAAAEAEAERLGFASVTLASVDVLSVAELADLRGRVSEWQLRRATVLRQLSQPEFDGLPDLDPDDLSATHDDARATLEASRARLDALGREHAKRSGRVARFAELAAGVVAAAEQWRTKSAANAAVLELDRLTRGLGGQRRMTLTTYVLRYWFNSVIAAANLRLAQISGGRYELRRTESPGARNERVGLGLSVLDRHTGAERSPRSLSGGETFYTSLALALGLADVVQAEAGGASLETLFVDEGFGSLDADTLDEVLDIIDGLRGRGRSVGIVSHVAELKERVPERLEIRRSRRDGPSTLRVVA